MKNTIYYFTGTGNSLAAARTLSGDGKDYGLVPITGLVKQDKVEIACEKAGFVFPVYFAGLPGLAKKFIKKLEFKNDCYIFAVLTCGVPWSCYAFQLMNRLLRGKKQKLSAAFYLKTVDNFIPKYRIPPPDEQEKLAAESGKRLAEIKEILSDGRKVIEKETAFYLYPEYPMFMAASHKMDLLFKTDGKCNGCGICERVCPVDNIRLADGRPKWLHGCEFCMACINCCPQKTIQWGRVTRNKGRYLHRDISIHDMMAQKKIYDD